MSYLDELNKPQKEAVFHKEGPLLIIAGAGAGKTRTIVCRIFHLIKSGVNPNNILAITFTNKAATEMKERISSLMKIHTLEQTPFSITEQPFIGTFHSLGVYILRQHGDLIGVKRHFSIVDKSTSSSIVKEALKNLGYDPKQYEPKKIQSIISKNKGALISIESYLTTMDNISFSQVVASVWRYYEETLFKQHSLDFDDLLGKTVELLKKHKNIRKYYHNLWHYLHIDEYQDTNHAQYTLSKLLVGELNNICVVGDTDQCLFPSTKITTVSGEKNISDLTKKDAVISASGNGGVCVSKIKKIKKRHYVGEIIEIKTKKGSVLKVTPEHIIFSKLQLRSDIYYVYLMYKQDKGFRIGLVRGSRSVGKSNKEENQIGLLIRCNQEGADKMWILKVCTTKEEALYWECFYSSFYGIPQLVFTVSGRKMKLSQNSIDKLYKNIKTQERVEKLFQETGLSFQYPHHTPQGTTKGNSEKKRTNIRLTMFSDKRKSEINPWSLSRVSINTTNEVLKKNLEKNGFSTRKGKKTDWRLEIARLDYGKAEEIAQNLTKQNRGLTLNRTALLTKSGRFLFLPAGSLHETMKIAHYKNKKLTDDTITSIKKTHYTGYVYDLNIENTHNYIANNITVHNCIYGWRGANIKNILRFEKDYPKTTIIFLEQNYRSTNTIIQAANKVIEKNTLREDKKLYTKNASGEKISLYTALNEGQEAFFVALKTQKLIEQGVIPSEIAVLYRANFQSRVLEEMFLSLDIPYQVLGTRFFERKEVKDILSFIRASLNPDSFSDIKRVINIPPRGIGKVTLAKIFGGQYESLPASMKKKVDNFYKLLQKIKDASLKLSPSELIKFIVKETALDISLLKEGEEGQERLENIKELVSLASRYDKLPKDGSLQKLLEDAALATDQDSLVNEQNKYGVKLMTVHASKGLEFPYVFITGLEQGLFPYENFTQGTSGDDFEKNEEERRLFYVALTRAGKKVYLTLTMSRTIFGSQQANEPSSFLEDIPEDLIEIDTLVEEGNEKDSFENTVIL